jgi:phospholipase D1/2
LEEALHQVMGDKVYDYISFFSLRNHTVLDDFPRTDLIYIHAKVLIADDDCAIIGSANINDRSLVGRRDSEVCVLLKGGDKVESTINGKSAMVSKVIRDFRIRLYKQHLGVVEDEKILIDPLGDDLDKYIKDRANLNTLLYREIFNCIPDDNFAKFDDFYEITPGEQPIMDNYMLKRRYALLKDKIVGHLVEFPIHFLRKESLDRKAFAKLISVKLYL